MEIIITTTSDSLRSSYFLPLTHHAMSISGCEHPLIIRDADPLERYFLAADSAAEDIFVLSDDDIIPCDRTALEHCIDIMNQHEDIGVLGLSWKRGLNSQEIGKWFIKPYSYKHPPVLAYTPTIWEVDHVGGLRIFRKEALFKSNYLPKVDYEKGYGDDMAICELVRQNGYKVCLTPMVWFHHLGDGYTTIWKK